MKQVHQTLVDILIGILFNANSKILQFISKYIWMKENKQHTPQQAKMILYLILCFWILKATYIYLYFALIKFYNHVYSQNNLIYYNISSK